MKLYIGIGETAWNGCAIPSEIGYACVSPVNGRTQTRETWVSVPNNVKVIQDSGAFSDAWETRLSFAEAWDRQDHHAQKHGYADQITHRASYDMLIDEVWMQGKRHKQRWSLADAQVAVDTCVQASHFAAVKRDSVQPNMGLIQSAQGVEAKQYLTCVQRILPYIDPERDKLGLGGWCILGIRRELMPIFSETIQQVIPFVAQEGVEHLHIWGVIYPPALGLLLWWADTHGLTVSTDSTSPVLNVVYGNWGYAEWRQKRRIMPHQDMGTVKIRHVLETKSYLATLCTTPHYVPYLALNTPRHPCVVCGTPVSRKALTCSLRCRKQKSRLSSA